MVKIKITSAKKVDTTERLYIRADIIDGSAYKFMTFTMYYGFDCFGYVSKMTDEEFLDEYLHKEKEFESLNDFENKINHMFSSTDFVYYTEKYNNKQ